MAKAIETLPRRDFMKTVALATTAAVLPASVNAVTIDPAFAAIDAHKVADRYRTEALEHEDEGLSWDHPSVMAAGAAAHDAHAKVLSAPPTTIAGAAAVLAYAGSAFLGSTVLMAAREKFDANSDVYQAAIGFLQTIAEALARMQGLA